MKVKSTSPIMKIEQVGKAVSAKSGATFVDLHFIKSLAKKIGPHYFGILSGGRPVDSFSAHASFGPGISYVLEQFEIKKQEFKGDKDPVSILLPGELYDTNDPEHSIEEGKVTFSQ
jgi:hypothetical protein